jgi:hypothetical protein
LPVGDGQAVVTAIVRDQVGQPAASVDVQFTGSLGSVSSAVAPTNVSGVVTSTFTAGIDPGQATVVAACGSLTQTVSFQLGGPQVIGPLILEVSATELGPRQEATVTVLVRDESASPVGGELVTLFGSLGEISPARDLSDGDGQVTATFTPGRVAGQATIVALAGYASSSANFQIGPLLELDQKVFLPLILRSSAE